MVAMLPPVQVPWATWQGVLEPDAYDDAWGLEAWEEAEAQIELSQPHLIELRSYLNALSHKKFFWKNLGSGATLGAKATMWTEDYIESPKNFSRKNFRKTEESLRQPLAMMVFA